MEAVPTAPKVSKVLTDVISSHVRQHTEELLRCIAQDHGLVFEELMAQYGHRQPNIDVGKAKKKTGQHMADANASTEPKKRGRKKKQKEELIETEEYDYNGITYLVDSDNNVYTYNVEQPVLVGTKLVDGRVKFLNATQ